jgi:hypothetical protein
VEGEICVDCFHEVDCGQHLVRRFGKQETQSVVEACHQLIEAASELRDLALAMPPAGMEETRCAALNQGRDRSRSKRSSREIARSPGGVPKSRAKEAHYRVFDGMP